MESSRLRLSKYSQAYRSRLLQGGGFLTKFLQKEGTSLRHLLQDKPSKIDTVLERFVSHSHQTDSHGNTLRLSKHAVLLLQVLRPELKHQLRSSWATLRAWEEAIPSQLRTPLPLCVLMGMICQARLFSCEAASSQQRCKWLIFSCLLAVGYFGLLRPGELLGIRRKHVCLPNSLTFALPYATIALQKPKNFRQLGNVQFVTIKHADTCNWLTWVCSGKASEQTLWPYSPAEFRRLFKKIRETLSLQSVQYSPASLRAGGATFYFDEFEDVGKLRLLGRWASMQSLEHYVQVGKGQQLLQTMSVKATRKLKTVLTHGHYFLALPSKLASEVDRQNLVPNSRLDLHGKDLGSACRQWASTESKTA